MLIQKKQKKYYIFVRFRTFNKKLSLPKTIKMDRSGWESKIFNELSTTQFEGLALEAFRFQFQKVKIYRDYCNLLGKTPENVDQLNQIPFLPISFFKSKPIIADDYTAEVHFTSSGTTRAITSNHWVADVSLYEKSFRSAFERFYGPVTNYCILALLPSYLERKGSSLVHMADTLIRESKHPKSGFYLYNYEDLQKVLFELSSQNQKTLLLGVTHALLDMAEQFPVPLSNSIVMETGGMKGRRKEMIREELHQQLKNSFNVSAIHSEYGMTELLSQAYSKGEGIFETPPWMKIVIRDTYDPFLYLPNGRSGGINIIDLTNIYSCCFIETQDLGKLFSDNQFTILGRFDQSDIRGCNLMVG